MMVALGAVEVATSSFQCLGASPHRGVLSGHASQGGLLVCLLLPLHYEGCFSKPQCLTEGTLGSLRSAAQALRPECALATSRAVSRPPCTGPLPLPGQRQAPAAHWRPATGVQSELLIGGMGWPGLVLRGPTICVASWVTQESLALPHAAQGHLLGCPPGPVRPAYRGGCDMWPQAALSCLSPPSRVSPRPSPPPMGQSPPLATSCPYWPRPRTI